MANIRSLADLRLRLARLNYHVTGISSRRGGPEFFLTHSIRGIGPVTPPSSGRALALPSVDELRGDPWLAEVGRARRRLAGEMTQAFGGRYPHRAELLRLALSEPSVQHAAVTHLPRWQSILNELRPVHYWNGKLYAERLLSGATRWLARRHFWLVFSRTRWNGGAVMRVAREGRRWEVNTMHPFWITVPTLDMAMRLVLDTLARYNRRRMLPGALADAIDNLGLPSIQEDVAAWQVVLAQRIRDGVGEF